MPSRSNGASEEETNVKESPERVTWEDINKAIGIAVIGREGTWEKPNHASEVAVRLAADVVASLTK